MNNFFYQKLAFTNLKKNRQMYFPYLLTCIGTIALFYNMASIVYNPYSPTQDLVILMGVGMYITAIFSFIFLFYTYRFLMKRRKKEFGLFNVLGMEKKHIGRIMLWENIMLAFASLIGGISIGLLFSKLVTMLLYRILNFDISFPFVLPPTAIIITLLLFVSIFFCTLVFSLIQVFRSKPIELIHGGNVGEKEPKTKILSTIIVLVSLGFGYYLALAIQTPLKA